LILGGGQQSAQPQGGGSMQAAEDAERTFLAVNGKVNDALKAIFDKFTDMQRKALAPLFDGEVTLLKFQQRAKNDLEFVKKVLEAHPGSGIDKIFKDYVAALSAFHQTHLQRSRRT